jgi:hypothetical protein
MPWWIIFLFTFGFWSISERIGDPAAPHSIAFHGLALIDFEAKSS